MPCGVAQEMVSLLQDPEGDVVFGTPGTDLGGYPTLAPNQDLAEVLVVETTEHMTFESLFHPPTGATVSASQPADLGLWFHHGGQGYRIDLTPSTGLQNQGAALYRVDATGSPNYIGPVEMVADPFAGSYTVQVPRDRIVDSQGARPYPGSEWSAFRAEVAHPVTPGVGVEVTPLGENGRLAAMDRIPDDGTAGEYTTLLGEPSAGHVRLFSQAPGRVSNGAAMTYVFIVMVSNEGVETERFALEVLDAPEAFTVDTPLQEIQIDGGGSLPVPVIVSTPFGHRHGEHAVITLEAQGIDDPDSRAVLDLTVYYLETPQPAGHHPTLWFHSDTASTQSNFLTTLLGDPLQRIYMNAIEEDPGDQGITVHGVNDSAAPTSFEWRVTLSPNLQIGLDVDLSGEVLLDIPIRFESVSQGALVDVSLMHVAPGPDGTTTTVIAEGRVFEGEVGPETLRLTAELEPLATADTFLPHPEGRLELLVTADLGRPTTALDLEAPRIPPGGSITLPLHEYREVRPDGLFTLGDFTWEAPTTQVEVVPGQTMSYDLRLTSHDGGEVGITMGGVNSQWATLSGDLSRFKVGETRDYTVTASVPTDAQVGDVMDVIVSAGSPNKTPSLVQLTAVVRDPSDLPDGVVGPDAFEDPSPRSTPVPGAPLGVVVVFAAVAWVRSRH